MTGPLSMLPDTPTASSFRAPGAAVDILGGSGGHPFNVLSIVIELPSSELRGGHRQDRRLGHDQPLT